MRDLESYKLRVEELERANAAQAQVVQQLSTIRKQSEEAKLRIQQLVEENAKLKALSEQRRNNVLELERQVARVSFQPQSAAGKYSEQDDELARLKKALQQARQEQQDSERSSQDIAERDKQISLLRTKLADFESKETQLEDYRAQIRVLQKQNAEKARLLSEHAGLQIPTRQLVVPSF